MPIDARTLQRELVNIIDRVVQRPVINDLSNADKAVLSGLRETVLFDADVCSRIGWRVVSPSPWYGFSSSESKGESVVKTGLTKEEALKQLDPQFHQAAVELNQAGLDWNFIMAFVVDLIRNWLNRPKLTVTGHCPDHLKAQASELRQKAGEMYLDALCHEHCCHCDE